MSNNSNPYVSLLMSGSELMSGDTIDSNSAYIAKSLLGIGLEVAEMVTVGDQHQQLAEQIKRLCQKSSLLVMNGGLGPTQDDLTAEVLANVAGTVIATHTEAAEHITNWCNKRGFAANKANMKQAELPLGCNIFPDAPGSAPAFYLTIDGCLVIATPGVPSELKNITQQHLLPFLQKHFSLARTEPWRKVQLLGIGESRLQQIINDDLDGINLVLDIGFRAGFPTLELKYKPQPSTSTTDAGFIDWEKKLLVRIADFVLGMDNFNLPETLVNLLATLGKTVSCAESCTGGLIASEITRIPGASAVFPGGIVSYSNIIKEKLLFVPENILESCGAVSAETVVAMCKGVLLQMGSDYGIAVSGIAGPEGGSVDKPAGTVWIAWGCIAEIHSVHLCIPPERKQFQNLVAFIGLDLLRRYASGAKGIPAYLARWQP